MLPPYYFCLRRLRNSVFGIFLSYSNYKYNPMWKEHVKSFPGIFRKMKFPCMIIEGMQFGFGELY